MKLQVTIHAPKIIDSALIAASLGLERTDFWPTGCYRWATTRPLTGNELARLVELAVSLGARIDFEAIK